MPPYGYEDARKTSPWTPGAIVKPGRNWQEDLLILNVGPHHTSTHGLIRFILALDGEEIVDLDMDIGYHHRGVEKIGERQSWHQFIPYTDRVDYLAGVSNNLPYLLAVETLADIQVPDRAQFIRVMLSEFFRLSNHLVWFATLAQDCGAIAPAFYTFREREKIMDIVELITGGRLHPSWFRLGGVAADLPEGWKEPIDAFCKIFPARIKEYEDLLTQNPIFEARTRGVGYLSREDAMDWGVTGPMLRACGLEWDLRKKIPYSGYEAFDFEVPYQRRRLLRPLPGAGRGDAPEPADHRAGGRPDAPGALYDRRLPLCHPREKGHPERHREPDPPFHQRYPGPQNSPGEAYAATEIVRGEQGYYVVSDSLNMAYRMRVRAPDFANVQAIPLMARGELLSDLIAIIGAVDFILPDTDR